MDAAAANERMQQLQWGCQMPASRPDRPAKRPVRIAALRLAHEHGQAPQRPDELPILAATYTSVRVKPSRGSLRDAPPILRHAPVKTGRLHEPMAIDKGQRTAAKRRRQLILDRGHQRAG